jgi:hypothetical protein
MPEYSNSQLSKFEECALQYKFPLCGQDQAL